MCRFIERCRLVALAAILGLVAGTPALAAEVLEPVRVTVEAVDVASREILADGQTWAMSSTAAIRLPGKKQGSLRDLLPGMHVQLDLVTNGPVPVVRTVTVVPD